MLRSTSTTMSIVWLIAVVAVTVSGQEDVSATTLVTTEADPPPETSTTVSRAWKPDPTCVCDPLCEPIPQGLLQSGMCNRTVARSDCPCCQVCARGLGDSCDQVAKPCDLSQKLACDPEENVCKESDLVVCEFEGEVYQEGEKYHSKDCELKCRCGKSGSTVCEPMECRRGLHRKGKFSDDPYCVEKSAGSLDKCCVLVICSEVLEDDEDDEEVTRRNVDKISQIEKEPSENKSKSDLADEPTKNLEFLQITPTTIQIQFPGITGGNLMYVEERQYRPKGLKETTPWQNAIILEGNKIFTLTGLKAGVKYRLRWQAPDKQYPDVMVSTKDFDEKPPKVIITDRTFNSFTISFDHFAPDNYEYGYVVMYKESNESAHWQSKESSHEDHSPTLDLPEVTINDLKPMTKYMVRVAIYDDYRTRSLGRSTTVIEVETAVGCVHKNQSYPVGEFNVGCENTCDCHKDGEVECGPRCSGPFHRAGTWADDPLCVERFVDGDECCVVVTCAAEEEGPCTEIECGPNAECRHEVLRGDEAATICVCKDGYTGDPDSEEGCSEPMNDAATDSGAAVELEKSPVKDKCQVKNESYAVGEEWFEGCEYKCQCSEKLEILCQPRCKIPPVTEQSDKCELRPDPEDSCCKILYCPDPSGNMDSLKPVSLPFDGCIFKNRSYGQGERFYDGCESQCQCMGYGDMVCLSRCPPTAPPPGQNCYTLPDASDPCCNITVCDKPVLDPDQNVKKEEVMKQNAILDVQAEEKEEVRPVKESRVVNVPDFAEAIPGTDYFGVEIGLFNTHHHQVTGVLYALNESTLLIKDFTYDGRGPDAFFMAGEEGSKPQEDGAFLISYPFEGVHYEYNDLSAPVLGPFNGEDVVLHLPDGKSVVDLKWLSVWCRRFAVNFGDVIWPKSIQDLKDSLSSSSEEENQVQIQETESSTSNDIADPSNVVKPGQCVYKSQAYDQGSEFYDGCENFCMCDEGGEVVCHEIKCPSKFGLDVINPFCLEWDEHEDFEPKPPMCCPPVPVCISDGSCEYKGFKFNNFDNLPANLTGCEKRCYCENGEVLCQDACYEIPETAPGYLSCPPEVAIKIPRNDRPCCLTWGCPKVSDIPLPEELNEVETEAFNETSVAFKIRLPRALDGVPGYYEVFYTSGLQGHPDPTQWPKQIITPLNGKLVVSSNDEASLILSDLLPNQQYFLMVHVRIKQDEEEVVISSDILSAKTLPEEVTTPEPATIMPIDVEMAANVITDTSAMISWRFFKASEKKYVDGVQIRFTQMSDGVPASGVPGTSPFIHRDTNFFHLQDLSPDTEYSVDLYIIPMPNAKVELVAESGVTFKTLPPVDDPFDLDVTLKTSDVTGNSIEVKWEGIPSPMHQYVSLFRVIYSEYHINALDESQVVYKEPKIDTPSRLRLRNLNKATRYQVWLEAYMRNGKIIKSNVLDVRTNQADDPHSGAAKASPTSQDKPSENLRARSESSDSYYNSMVAAAIIAAFAILALIVVTGLYLRRTTTYKAIISGQNRSGTGSSLPTSTRAAAAANRSKNGQMKGQDNGGTSIEMNGTNGKSEHSIP